MTPCSMCGRVRRRYRQNGLIWWLANFIDVCFWCDLQPAVPQAPWDGVVEQWVRDDPPGAPS